MEGIEGADWQVGDRLEQDEPRAPVFLLVGVVLGAALAFIVAVLRRGSRPSTSPPGDPVLEAARRPEPPPAVQIPALPVPAAPRAASTRWPTATKYVVGVGLFLAVLGLLYISRGVIPTVILAALVAFIVSPLVRFFQKRLKVKKGLAVAFTYLLVIIALLLIPLILLPAIVNAVNSLLAVDFRAIAGALVQSVGQASAVVAGVPVVNSILGPLLDSLLQALQAISSAQAPQPVSYSLTVSEAGSMLAAVVGRMTKVLGPVVGAIASLVFMVLISVYISLSSDEIRGWYPKLIPPGYEPEVAGLFKRIGGLWGGYLRGELTLMVLIGTVVWLGNLVLGNSYALLLGVLSGFMELIPNIGPAIALIPGVLLALMFGSSHFALSNVAFALVVLGFYLLVQVLENQFVVPKVMGDAVELPPLVVILGAFVGGATAGLLGVLLATPVIATGREVFSYLYNKILEPPQAVGPPTDKLSLFAAVAGGVRNLAGRIKRPFRRGGNPLPESRETAVDTPLAGAPSSEALSLGADHRARSGASGEAAPEESPAVPTPPPV